MTPSKKPAVTIPTLREFVDAGAHFGHRRSRTYPTARKYTYTVRDRVFVINLEDTRRKLEEAAQLLYGMATEGKTVLFVGTKPQATDAIAASATASGMLYLNHRWPGGMLTNFDTIKKNLDKLQHYQSLETSEKFEDFTKKERGHIKKQIAKLSKTFAGVLSLKRMPDALVIVDITEEDIATAEARKMGIPIVAIVDTNANPDLVEYPIPANDDSRKTIEMILSVLTESIIAGKKSAPVQNPEPTAETAPVEATPTEPAAEPVTTKAPAKKTAAKKPAKATKKSE